MIVSQGTSRKSALPYSMIATGWYFESAKNLLVRYILVPSGKRRVTALSAASATALRFRTATSAVMLLPANYTRGNSEELQNCGACPDSGKKSQNFGHGRLQQH